MPLFKIEEKARISEGVKPFFHNKGRMLSKEQR